MVAVAASASAAPTTSTLIHLLLHLLLHIHTATTSNIPLSFREAPKLRNGESCPSTSIHIAMTLNANYLCGTAAAVLSILQHSACPENVLFHLAHTLPSSIPCLIYLDSDLIMVDDVADRPEGEAPGWSPELSRTFRGRRPCYFNTGVMVMDLEEWRRSGYTERVERWMVVQKQRRIYELGSLPPFLLVVARRLITGGISMGWEGIMWKGGVEDCRRGPSISLLQWSGKGKP